MIKGKVMVKWQRDGKPGGDHPARRTLTQGYISTAALLAVVPNYQIRPGVEHDSLFLASYFHLKKRLLSLLEPLPYLGRGEKEKSDGLVFPS